MPSDQVIVELDIAIAEQEEFSKTGTPTRHPMADLTLGNFIGFSTLDTSREPIPPDWSAVCRYSLFDIKLDRKVTRYEYDKRLKGVIDPPVTVAVD